MSKWIIHTDAFLASSCVSGGGLVEGVDFTVDRVKGEVTFTHLPLHGVTVLSGARKLAETPFHPHGSTGKQTAQWKRERKGRK